GITEQHYIEIIGVSANTVAIDTMARGLVRTVPPPPIPEPGAPSRYRPPGAKPGGAWVPWIEPAEVSERETGLYPTDRPPANIMMAMSLVPEEARSFFDLVT